MQWAPYQKANEYAVNIAKNAAPTLAPVNIPNFNVPYPALTRDWSYIVD